LRSSWSPSRLVELPQARPWLPILALVLSSSSLSELAASVLGHIGPAASAAIPIPQSASRSPDPCFSRAAVEALQQIEEKKTPGE
jgi:hypothetical protein